MASEAFERCLSGESGSLGAMRTINRSDLIELAQFYFPFRRPRRGGVFIQEAENGARSF